MLSSIRAGALSLCTILLSGPLAAQQAAPLPRVTVEAVAVETVEARVSISGSLVAREEVLVAAQITGYPIESLPHDVGDHVDKDDVMARINDRTLSAKLLQAEAEAARAEAATRQARSQIDSADATADEAARALERAQRLLASGTTTQAALDQAVAADLTARAAAQAAADGAAVAEAQVQEAHAARDIAALNLDNAVIRAPVSGIVSERAAQVGALAGSSALPMYRIIAGGEVELEAEVIETELGTISVGQPADLRIAGLGAVTGVVRRISPTVDPVTRLGLIRITLSAEDLRPGLFATGWIVTAQRDAPTVPLSAVLTDATGDFLLVAEGGTLRRRDVVAGLVSGDRREIVQGVETGDLVVTRAGGFFAAGDKVTPITGAEPAQ